MDLIRKKEAIYGNNSSANINDNVSSMKHIPKIESVNIKQAKMGSNSPNRSYREKVRNTYEI